MRFPVVVGLILLGLAEISQGSAEFLQEGTRQDDLRGEQAARRDLQSGKLVVRFLGLPADDHYDYAKFLRKRYGIVLSPDGCSVTGALIREIDAYNKVMDAAIKQRYGPNVFDLASEEYRRLKAARPFHQPPGRR